MVARLGSPIPGFRRADAMNRGVDRDGVSEVGQDRVRSGFLQSVAVVLPGRYSDGTGTELEGRGHIGGGVANDDH
jgi:hypothetical protein